MASARITGNRRARIGLCDRNCRGNGVRVVPVDRLYVPAVILEPNDLVLRHRLISGAVIGHAVVVPQKYQLPEPQMAGQRNDLGRDALHQTAIAGIGIGVVVDDPIAETIVQNALGDCHANGVADPCPRGPVVVSIPASI